MNERGEKNMDNEEKKRKERTEVQGGGIDR